MKLLNVSVLIIALASLAGAGNQPRAGDFEKAPGKTIVNAGSGLSSNPTREGIAEGVTIANDHAFVKNEVVLVQGQQRFVIPMKSITGVSYTAANLLYLNVSASPLTEVPSPALLVKTKDHYVGIVWKDKSQTRRVVVKVGIGEYGGFMNALEAAGIKAVNSDALSIAK
jgi:hypothetical protein